MIPTSIAAVWFAFIFMAEPIEHASQHRLVEASAEISVGMTPENVLAILGEPDVEYGAREGVTWFRIGARPKQWMYGTSLNLDFVLLPYSSVLNPIPINVRWFEYADDDLVVFWTNGDRVSRVQRPNFEVPEFAFRMLDAANFVDAVTRTFVFNPN